MIQTLSERLEKSEVWKVAARRVHKKHATVRRGILDEDDIEVVRLKLGKKGLQAFLDSGVAGSSADSIDMKCLHAWMGDHLFHEDKKTSSDSNTESEPLSPVLGHAVYEALVDKGIDLSGTINCHFACDPTSTMVAVPPNPRNKKRLKSRKEIARRKRRRKEDIEVE